MNELHLEVYTRIAKCINKFNKVGISSAPFEEQIKVEFNLKGRTAGQAFYRQNKLRFNEDLLRKYKQEFITTTVDHEVAHLLAHFIEYNCKAHGETWRMCMLILGHNKIERCHNMETTPARRVKKYEHRCECIKTHLVGAKVHKKIQNGHIYTCKGCKTRLLKAV